MKLEQIEGGKRRTVFEHQVCEVDHVAKLFLSLLAEDGNEFLKY
jgi:hypothetical protein